MEGQIIRDFDIDFVVGFVLVLLEQEGLALFAAKGTRWLVSEAVSEKRADKKASIYLV